MKETTTRRHAAIEQAINEIADQIAVAALGQVRQRFGLTAPTNGTTERRPTPERRRGRRRLTAAEKKAISLRMRKYWRTRRAEK
jgi:hypothetical protein